MVSGSASCSQRVTRLACRALGFQGTCLAAGTPVAMYHQFILFRCHAPDQTLNGWTPVLVVFSDIEQIPLAEAALRYIARRLESWQVGRDPAASQARISSPLK